jgi:hypothetical protein
VNEKNNKYIDKTLKITNPNSLIKSSLRIDKIKSRSSTDGVDEGFLSDGFSIRILFE